MTEKERKDSLREHRNSDINNLKSVVGNFNKKNSTLIGAEDHKKLAKELALENSEGTIQSSNTSNLSPNPKQQKKMEKASKRIHEESDEDSDSQNGRPVQIFDHNKNQEPSRHKSNNNEATLENIGPIVVNDSPELREVNVNPPIVKNSTFQLITSKDRVNPNTDE